MNKLGRWICALGALMLLTGLVACRPQGEDVPPRLSLSYRQTELCVGMSERELLLALGDDFTVSEAESCAGQGVDRLYRYPSVLLYVFAPVNGEATLTGVTYTDDGARTEDGLFVGCALADVIAARGEPQEQTDAYLIYRGDGASLTFTVRDGRVTGIALTQS